MVFKDATWINTAWLATCHLTLQLLPSICALSGMVCKAWISLLCRNQDHRKRVPAEQNCQHCHPSKWDFRQRWIASLTRWRLPHLWVLHLEPHSSENIKPHFQRSKRKDHTKEFPTTKMIWQNQRFQHFQFAKMHSGLHFHQSSLLLEKGKSFYIGIFKRRCRDGTLSSCQFPTWNSQETTSTYLCKKNFAGNLWVLSIVSANWNPKTGRLGRGHDATPNIEHCEIAKFKRWPLKCWIVLGILAILYSSWADSSQSFIDVQNAGYLFALCLSSSQASLSPWCFRLLIAIRNV